jgi:hypothetical protein
MVVLESERRVDVDVWQQPITRADLLGHATGPDAYSVIVAGMPRFEIVSDTEDGFEDRLCRLVLSRDVGIPELGYSVVGHLGDTIYLRITGYVDPES